MALITTQGAIVVALIPVLISTRRHARNAATDAAEARYQVANDHTTNLREEGDERHQENTKLLNAVLTRVDELAERITGVKSDIRGIRRDVGRLADADRTHEDRIHELEKTHPPRRKHH